MAQKDHQIKLLQLAEAQLLLSLQEIEQPFNKITKSFIKIAENNNQIDRALLSSTQADIEKISLFCQQNQKIIKQTVIDFQFYDRTKQRLTHILNTLQQMIKVLSHDGTNFNERWQSVFNSIEQSYTIREEIELYHAIQQNKGIEEAIQKLVKKSDTSFESSEIELF